MKQTGKNITVFMAALLLTLFAAGTVFAADPADRGELTVLFTHDSHSYLYPTVTVETDERIEHGGAARLASLIRERAGDDTVYLDGGDYSMGTLYQAAYSTDAYELRNLGLTGCAVTTFGNHEFDYGAGGAADMLKAALRSGDPLPAIVSSNIIFSEEMTEDQAKLKAAFEEYGVSEYTILERAGYKLGVFGLVGYDGIECIQTPLSYIDYKEAAKGTVQKLKDEGCDFIIALSHAGTSGDGENGEDFDLAKEVPDIDLIISAHSHSAYEEPVLCQNTYVVSCGEYLTNLGSITLKKDEEGKTQLVSYELIPIDESVHEDTETLQRFKEYKKHIEATYLKDKGGSFDRILAFSNTDMMSLSDMYASHEEYTVGDLIADSYIYEAERNGINDIDVALVGLGTVRGSVKKGPVTAADAFEICSLGVGSDGTAGHPLVAAYITGKELKLLTELDASLGTLVSSIKMSYSGLEYTFNTKRIILDRVTDVHLLRTDGTIEEIDDNKLYKVTANMYSINMLGMLNSLTKGILSITPKDAEGNPITDYYAYALKQADGKEIKEWVAFMNYLKSFPEGKSGYPEIPARYERIQGRKNKTSVTGIEAITVPGQATKIIPAALGIVAFVLFIIIFGIVRIVKLTVRLNREMDETLKSRPVGERIRARRQKRKELRERDRAKRKERRAGK